MLISATAFMIAANDDYSKVREHSKARERGEVREHGEGKEHDEAREHGDARERGEIREPLFSRVTEINEHLADSNDHLRCDLIIGPTNILKSD